jgi:branched-chain amino acid transport system substrate-binding protein
MTQKRAGGTGKVIKVGHLASLTGDAALWGNWEKEGIDLAVEEINERGGIDGRKLIVIHEDDKADPKTGVSAFQKLIDVDKVPVVIGATTSSVTLACAPIAEKRHVVLITPSAQSPKISEAGDYIFRVFASSTVEGNKLADLAKRFSLNRVAILYVNNAYGFGLSAVIKQRMLQEGRQVVANEAYSDEAKNFRTQLAKIKAAKPQALYLLGYPRDMALILKQMKEMNLTMRVFAPNSFEADEILKWAGNAAEGVIYVYPVLPDSRKLQAVRQRFKAKYGKEMNVYNGMGYDTMHIVALAMQKGGLTGEGIKNALYTIKDYPGVTGPITFDANGDVMDRPMVTRIVKNGRFVDYP